MTDEKIITYFYAVQILTNNGALQGPSDGDISLIEMKNGIEKPKDSDIKAKLAELQLEYDAQEYARNRATAYPSTGDQLDMQYHDQLDGTTTWKDAVAKVKSDNPKPE